MTTTVVDLEDVVVVLSDCGIGGTGEFGGFDGFGGVKVGAGGGSIPESSSSPSSSTPSSPLLSLRVDSQSCGLLAWSSPIVTIAARG